ncbi:MAG: DUF1858 domain-containing protein [Clostridiales bacterium]|nr:DUF1858 domain-containing protein [Clostridiales bacterium]
MKEITKDMKIIELLEINEDLGEVLMEAGMHCLGCAAAHGETIEQACQVHGIDPDELIERLNFYNAG